MATPRGPRRHPLHHTPAATPHHPLFIPSTSEKAATADGGAQSSPVLMSADRPWAIVISLELFIVQAVRSVTASMTSRALG